MYGEGVHTTCLPHQGHPSRQADRQKAASDTRCQRDQQPLAELHVGMHRDNREHQWDIVEDSRQNTDQDIRRGRTPLAVEHMRHQREVAQET